ncbi:hypothetical protein [Lysinibacillus sp. BPa_S21]|uniref:hypothetical protein n=1 Tax=Lysinibacillus sp. BPa_S21 TaxID=2932478 RepID=UPI00201166FF|nr:hypothetical protein [Lysinibacillus sp. BPa_S21]MCL1698248.1 hypothetical protein [Lysinibacillus sp. BPa_S21]
MSQLNDAISKKIDISFCIEKEISRHYLYRTAKKILETTIEDEVQHDLIVKNLALWFQKIHAQQITDIQKYYIYKEIMGKFNDVIDISITKNLIKQLVIGYKLLQLLKQKIEHYQVHKDLKCPYLIFLLLGMQHTYSSFLIELDPKSINLINMINANESIARSKDKNLPSNRKNRRKRKKKYKNDTNKIWLNHNKLRKNIDD